MLARYRSYLSQSLLRSISINPIFNAVGARTPAHLITLVFPQYLGYIRMGNTRFQHTTLFCRLICIDNRFVTSVAIIHRNFSLFLGTVLFLYFISPNAHQNTFTILAPVHHDPMLTCLSTRSLKRFCDNTEYQYFLLCTITCVY